MKKLQVIGNIVRDAELRESNGRKAVNFTVAVNESYKNKEGQKVETATFYSCTLWREVNQSAEVMKYLLKGTKVFVEGKPEAVLYKTKENKTAIDNKINVKELTLLSAAKDNSKEESADAPQHENAMADMEDAAF